MDTPLIEIDDRERNEELIGFLRSRSDLVCRTIHLETGDFRIDRSVIVERKTISDFCRSLFDGRLFSQASRLVRAPERTALILEGATADWQEIQVKREAVQGTLISLMLVFDIPVLRSNGPAETGKLLLYTGRQLVRARTEGQIPQRRIKAKRRASRQRQVLQALPGVGPDRAKRLLEQFGSVRDCLAAEEEILSQIKGIGPVIAERIVRTVEEESSNGSYNRTILPI